MSVSIELPAASPITPRGNAVITSTGAICKLPLAAPIRPISLGALVTYTGPIPEGAQDARWATAISQAAVRGRPLNPTSDYMQRIRVPEGQDVCLSGRITNTLRTAYLYRGDITAITYAIYDTSSSTPDTPIHAEDLIVSQVMQTALVDDASWTRDATGYAYRFTVPGHHLAQGGRTYRVEVFFKSADHGPVPEVWEIETEGMYSDQDLWGSR